MQYVRGEKYSFIEYKIGAGPRARDLKILSYILLRAADNSMIGQISPTEFQDNFNS